MMKKILALVLIMAVSTMAVTFTGSYDAGTGKVTIAYDAPIVGMALDVDATGVTPTAVTLPAFFDVFMDYAYTQGASYVYGAGNAIANQDAAGVAAISSAFCISAGGLEDNAGDVVPATGTITVAVTGTVGSVVISANTLRGGVVDYNGAMTTNLPITVQIQDVPSVCLGDADADGYVSPEDINFMVIYLGDFEADGYWAAVTPATAAMDFDNDDYVSPEDINAMVIYLGAFEADGYWAACAAN